ncbi:MAG: hypothetical protein HFE57_03615 [Firmicutes bacterium]|jgi:hypothetical protein|nr:hypothetical protein [Bacillota bacterium]
MNLDDINKLSLPILDKLLEDLPKRICEKLGLPYDNDEETQQAEIITTKKEEFQYPSRKVEKLLSKGKTTADNNIYDATNKQQFMNFFAGLADIEDTT